MRFLAFLFPVLWLVSCSENGPVSSPKGETNGGSQPPAPGVVVAEDSLQHRGDGLNQSTFRVTVTKAPERGVYTVNAQDGPNKGETQFTLPKGGEDFSVALRKDLDQSRIEIGFSVPGDPEFHPYYEVVSKGKTIRAQYTKAYRFE